MVNSCLLTASIVNEVACSRARMIVTPLVHWVIFCCPAPPSFFSVSSRGITTASNCMMMELVM